jgi:hypothetical protein
MDMSSRYKAIVVGAGPAGLFAAIRLAERAAADASRAAAASDAAQSGILVLERGPKPGRKLLVTGSGQCNLTHAGSIADFLGHYGGGAKPESAARFLKPALFGFTNDELLEWFRARGLDFETEENGKIFPSSRRASSILEALKTEADRLGVRIETGCRVLGIKRRDYFFSVSVEASGEAYEASSLLIAAGGASYPATGSSGDGYALAASLGHRIIAPRPALTPVFVRDFTLGSLAGLSFRGAGLAIRRTGTKKIEREGDLLITHEGLSGPLILDASRYIAAGDILEIRFADAAIEEFRSRFDDVLGTNPQRLVRTLLAEFGLTRSMAERFCDLAGIGHEQKAADLPRAKREAICRLACAHPFEVERLGALEAAMVTAGGVDICEVNAGTMESRIASGLYFAGEVLDIDGDSGGYNLQAAFSTGALAAAAIAV